MSGTSPPDRPTPVGDTIERTVYYDPDRGTYHTQCDADDYEPVSTALLLTVSSVLGVEPDDLEPLSERVDPDALNSLFADWCADEPRVGNGTVSFSFSQCAVTIRADGELVIDPDPDAGSESPSDLESEPERTE
ncbi:HalOD1 output domain-containing protein [Halopiger thermotolerans]